MRVASLLGEAGHAVVVLECPCGTVQCAGEVVGCGVRSRRLIDQGGQCRSERVGVFLVDGAHDLGDGVDVGSLESAGLERCSERSHGGECGRSFVDPVAGAGVALRGFGKIGYGGVAEFVESTGCADFEGVEEPAQPLHAGEEGDGGVLVGDGELYSAKVADDVFRHCEFHAYRCTEGV